MNSIPRLLWAIGFFAGSLAFTFSAAGEVANLRGLDLFRSPHPPHPDSVLLAIDSKSLAEIGRWPWPRDIHAQLLEKLEPAQPAIVAFDVIFSTPANPEHDAALAQRLSAVSFPVVLGAEVLSFRNPDEPPQVSSPLPILTTASTVSVGHTNIPVNTDGLARGLAHPLTSNGTLYQPFSFIIAETLHASLPTDPHNFLVNLAGPAGQFTTYSISDVLNNRVPRQNLAGKIILIGATTSSLHDTVLVPERTPVMAGVEWQANVVDNLLLNRAVRRLPVSFTVVIHAAMVWLFFAWLPKLTKRRHSWWLLAITALGIVISFILWHWQVALAYAGTVILMISLFVWHGLYRWYITEAEKRQLRQTFQHYFSPPVLRTIIHNPQRLQLGGERREVTVLFSDIRSFTTLTEQLPPEKLSSLLHEYFTEMTEEILATDGVLDKFIGDAIMAFWGAPIAQPDQADRAVHSAIGMIKRLQALQPTWQAAGYPLIECGIGITTGHAIVGNMGSRKRFDYTVIGDTVNAAARLEGLNKEYKSHIIIAESTKQQLTLPVTTTSLGQVTVKGKTVPITVYTITPF